MEPIEVVPSDKVNDKSLTLTPSNQISTWLEVPLITTCAWMLCHEPVGRTAVVLVVVVAVASLRTLILPFTLRITERRFAGLDAELRKRIRLSGLVPWLATRTRAS